MLETNNIIKVTYRSKSYWFYQKRLIKQTYYEVPMLFLSFYIVDVMNTYYIIDLRLLRKRKYNNIILCIGFNVFQNTIFIQNFLNDLQIIIIVVIIITVIVKNNH